jgi:hypothetical protein
MGHLHRWKGDEVRVIYITSATPSRRKKPEVYNYNHAYKEGRGDNDTQERDV